MNQLRNRHIAFVLASTLFVAVFAAGCSDDDEDGQDTGPVADTAVEDTGEDVEPDTEAPRDTEPDDIAVDTDQPDGVDDTGDVGPTYDFRTAGPDEFDQIDRVGMPAVSTVLAGDQKNAYNRGTPQDDVDEQFVPTVVQNLTAIHNWFDPGLQALGLTPCSMQDNDGDNLPDCLGQEVVSGGPSVVSLVVPDTLTLDTSREPGFPNGRLLPDPVIDVTLAVILLDMSQHSPTTFAEIPVNPPENDVNMGEFASEFPYLLEPHTP